MSDEAQADGAMTVEDLAAVEAARQDGATLEEALGEHGLDEGTWIAERPRVLGEVASSASGFRAYQAALEQAQDAAFRPVTPLYDDLAAWIAYCAAIEARGPRIAEDAGLTVADLARLERHWRKRFGEDRTLAKTAKELRDAPPPEPLPAIVIGPRSPKAPSIESPEEVLAEAFLPAGDELDALEQAAVLAALLAQNAGDDAFARRGAGSRAEAQATVEAATARIAGDAAGQRFFRGRVEHHRRALAQAASRPSPSAPVPLPARELVPELRPNVAAHVAMAPAPVAAKARDLTAEVDALVIDAAPLPFRADPNASPPAPTADHGGIDAHAVGETAELTLDHLGLAATPFESSAPLSASSGDIDGTLHLDAGALSFDDDALPFAPDPDAAPPPLAADELPPSASIDETSAIDLALLSREALPFGDDEPSEVASVPHALETDLQRYASYRTELRLAPRRAPEIRARYGVADEASHDALVAMWDARFVAEPALATRYVVAVRAYQKWLESSGGVP